MTLAAQSTFLTNTVATSVAKELLSTTKVSDSIAAVTRAQCFLLDSLDVSGDQKRVPCAVDTLHVFTIST